MKRKKYFYIQARETKDRHVELFYIKVSSISENHALGTGFGMLKRRDKFEGKILTDLVIPLREVKNEVAVVEEVEAHEEAREEEVQ